MITKIIIKWSMRNDGTVLEVQADWMTYKKVGEFGNKNFNEGGNVF